MPYTSSMASLWIKRAAWLSLAGLWMSLIFYLSSRSSIPVDVVESGTPISLALRKAGHFLAFGTLALFLRWGLGPWRSSLKVAVVAFALTVAYAVGDEVHQTFTPGRTGSAADVAIDSAGALAAVTLWRALERWTALVHLWQRIQNSR